MEKEEWLNEMFFDTGLYEFAGLRGKDDMIIRLYLQHNQTAEQIAEKLRLPVREVESITRRAMKKLLCTSKDVLATKVLLSDLLREKEVLQYLLATFRERFKHELTNKELTARYHRLNLPVTSFSFSGRAQNVFAYSNIKTLNDLAAVTVKQLKGTKNAGTKTVDEIVAKAKELGITLLDKNVHR